MSQISENLHNIKQVIKKQAVQCGRSVETINLVAVSKKQSREKIQQALNEGHRVFGENRVQEAWEHWGDIHSHYNDLKLHLIGPLQTNKVKDAVALFDVIETLDRPKLAENLAKEMEKQNRSLACFVQVNIGEEEQKSGLLPNDLERFLSLCRALNLNIQGLMCIPPVQKPPAPYFALLAQMAQKNNLDHVSMGMSNDFDKAIPLGATYVRVGTAIFGARD